jgi:hypothetical protein
VIVTAISPGRPEPARGAVLRKPSSIRLVAAGISTSRIIRPASVISLTLFAGLAGYLAQIGLSQDLQTSAAEPPSDPVVGLTVVLGHARAEVVRGFVEL